MDPIYEPREDSHLLARYLKTIARGDVLDMGTGSGFLAEAASEKADHVLAVDINPLAIERCRISIKNDKIEFRQSDLFSNIEESFDLIVFNPPYLPDDSDVKDIALDGGKHGWELAERFLIASKKHLKRDGRILLLFSSLTNRKKIDSILKNNMYSFKLLGSEKFAFETLYVYMIQDED